MQKGGPECRRAAQPLVLRYRLLGCRLRRGLLMSDRALSQATARAAAMRHSLGDILRWHIFQSLLRCPSPLERLTDGGRGLSAGGYVQAGARRI